jgi:diphosphomevalonate decarboxylase
VPGRGSSAHTAEAAPNFALAKYWGKADDAAMVPAVPSLSITLDGPLTRVTVHEIDAAEDEVTLDGEPVDERWRARTRRFLDVARCRARVRGSLRVETTGGVPPAAGLASSAAYFAALARAASETWGLDTGTDAVSDLARRGSVSAARSVPAGFVVLDPDHARGDVLAAHTAFPARHWDLAVLVAVVDPGPKEVGSSDGMKRTRETSPYYPAWVESSRELFERCLRAVEDRDLAGLGAAAESSCTRMHAAALAAEPPLLYLAPATLGIIDAVRRLRSEGTGCFYTVDAGPQVKVVCPEQEVERVREGIRAAGGVHRVLVHRPGGGTARPEASGDH